MRATLLVLGILFISFALVAQPGGALPVFNDPLPRVETTAPPHYVSPQDKVSPTAAILSADSVIRRAMTEISRDSVQAVIAGLQAFQTRYAFAANRNAVAKWIYDKFVSYGYTEVRLDSFYHQNVWHKNVIAILRGTVTPESYIVTGGHHDSMSGSPMTDAPGADDNASGTAAVMETARVLKRIGYQPAGSIVFVTFGAEEIGLVGSYVYAQQAFNTGMNIKLMINHDMISYRPNPDVKEVDINIYRGAESFQVQASAVAAQYTGLTALRGSTNSSGSDSYSFYQFGYPAIYFEERYFSPWYHTTSDQVQRYDMEYCAEITRASCAMVMYTDQVPAAVKSLAMTDMGNGSSLRVRWNKAKENDIVGYRLRLGPASGSYVSDQMVTDTTIVLTGLNEGVTVFAAVSVIDADGFESVIAEASGTPFAAPLPPAGFVSVSKWMELDLSWQANKEEDLRGYYLYRKATKGDTAAVRVSAEPLTGTSLTITPPVPGDYYKYYLTAVDTGGTESVASPEIKTRPVSLTKSLGVMHETANGTGEPMKPTASRVDSFYTDMLGRFEFETVYLNEARKATLGDLGAYKAILWHGNDLSDYEPAQTSVTALRQYLEAGGKVLITSYFPTKAFGNNSTYPVTFGPGFLRDVLKIASAEHVLFSRFTGAFPNAGGYPVLTVDSAKTPDATKGYLNIIESLEPAAGATSVYAYETTFDPLTNFGKMKGKSVGVEYIGPTYSAVTLSVPLYWIDRQNAKELLTHVLANRFGLLTSVKDKGETRPLEFRLEQNYPNPFNPSTQIQFTLPAQSAVTLRVYDILGRQVAELIDQTLAPGTHQVRWEPERTAPSGIYYYRLESGSQALTGKMLLLK